MSSSRKVRRRADESTRDKSTIYTSSWSSHGRVKLLTDRSTSIRLSRIRQSSTSAELLVRQVVSATGHRFRTHNRDLPGSPDLANRARGWAIFVHGCFWHHHVGCVRGTIPTRNRRFWLGKFAANRARDRRSVQDLRRTGFRILVIWECEIRSIGRLGNVVFRFLNPPNRRRSRSRIQA